MDPKELLEVAERIDETSIGQFLKAITPAAAAVSRLMEIGLNTLESRKAESRLLSPTELAKELDVAPKTLQRFQAKWDWFRPEYGKGKSQKYSSDLIERYRAAKRSEED